MLLALSVLSSCGSAPRLITETKTVEVKVATFVPLSEEDTNPCPVPTMEVRTVGDMRDLIAEQYTALFSCNDQMKRVRDQQPD